MKDLCLWCLFCKYLTKLKISHLSLLIIVQSDPAWLSYLDAAPQWRLLWIWVIKRWIVEVCGSRIFINLVSEWRPYSYKYLNTLFFVFNQTTLTWCTRWHHIDHVRILSSAYGVLIHKIFINRWRYLRSNILPLILFR